MSMAAFIIVEHKITEAAPIKLDLSVRALVRGLAVHRLSSTNGQRDRNMGRRALNPMSSRGSIAWA
jgi:hypothetical protein